MPNWSRYLAALLMLAALPGAAAEDLPVPPGSRKNDSLSGATSIAPGKNYTHTVYETEERIDAVTDFYARRLSGAIAMREGESVRFSTAGGTVKLAPLGKGTRITLIVGPR